jgi:hypothetical protein
MDMTGPVRRAAPKRTAARTQRTRTPSWLPGMRAIVEQHHCGEMRDDRLMLGAPRRVPSTAAVALLYLVLVLAMLLAQNETAEIVGIVMLVLLLAYCGLRRSRRVEVFGCAAAPGAFGTLLHDFTGASPKWGLVLVPIVFAQLMAIDRADRRELQKAA